ncbi:MAG TPA: translation elongation factor 4, partial [Opitutales bacterium]|nr:translation elongation factor 4 [Opitutales bacterium]
MSNPSKTRNFCIIAHIDHGKTTLSDRLLEATGAVQKRDMKAQLLDSMDLERERGITIKSHPVTVHYKHTDGSEYQFNLIDTPGHVDFSYEVSRSLAACEGVLLLVDAGQGVEAQTVANANLAINLGLAVIPVINKVDLPGANIEGVRHQIEEILSIPADEAVLASGKTGIGIPDILSAIVTRVPEPRWADHPHARMLIFDCVYDSFKGVVCYVRVFSGSIRLGDSIMMMSDGEKTEVKEIGRFAPKMTACASGEGLEAGDVGYITTSIKDLSEVKIGDTITMTDNPATEPLIGYMEVRPMVFAGIYPIDTSDYEKLKVSMAKLRLNDASFTYQAENSLALGFGFRCGFLGLLHMEIVMERIRREYDLDIISTYPSVVYKVRLTDGSEVEVDNPVKMPDPSSIDVIREPTIAASLHIPSNAIGDILALVMEKRGVCGKTETIDGSRVILHVMLPLNEILIDFNDRLKSITKGYGSMDYDLAEYMESKLVKMDILVNGDP